MNEELLRALGINVEQAKEQALNRGILGGILNLAAMSGPQARPVGTAQGLAQAVMGGMGAYESSFDKTLRDALTNLQVKSLMQKEQERQQLQKLLPQVFQVQRGPETSETYATETGDFTMTKPGPVTGVGINRQMLPLLAATPGGLEVAGNLMKLQESMQPKTYTLKPGEQVVTESGEVKARVAPTPDKVDLGNRIAFINPETLQPISIITKDKDPEKVTTTELAVGKNFTAEAAPYIGIAQAYSKINAAAQNKSPAGDLSLIFGYMKILDPGSVVREGEFATAQNTGSVPESVSALYNRVISGERLTDKQRADFLAQARNLVQSQKDLFNSTIAPKYVSLIETNKLNPKNVVFDPFTNIDLSKPPVVKQEEGQTRARRLSNILFPAR